MNAKEKILRARSKKSQKGKLSQAQVRQLLTAIAQGASYNRAGKDVGISSAAARYHFLRADPKVIEALA